MQEKPGVQLKTLIEQGDIKAALQLLAAVETWPQEALNDALHELAWRAACYEALPWTDAHLTLATALLDAGANASARRYPGSGTPLHYAAQTYNLAFVTLLLARGAEVNAVTKKRETPLHMALYRCDKTGEHLPVVRALLEAGADPNISALHYEPSWKRADRPRDTPLELAIDHRALETAQLLVAYGAHPKHKGVACTRPVFVATQCALSDKDLTLLNWLLTLDVNPNVLVVNDSPLSEAADYGNLAVMEALIQAGADMEWRQGMALTAAAKSRKIEAVRYLLELGAMAHIRALGAAIHNNDLALVQLLVEHGAPLDKRSTYTDNKLPLTYAREQPERRADIIAYLLEIVTAHNPQQARRQTQRHYNTQLLKVADNPHAGRPLAYWLEQGANPKARNKYGRTALHYVVERGEDLDLLDARLLLDVGADVNAHDRFGYTPLHQAARHDDPVLLCALLDAGADPAATLTQGRLAGWTPLHFALSYQHAANAALLRPLSPPVSEVAPGSHGLRGVFANDKDGFTPTDNTCAIHLRVPYRCLDCNEIALYIIGGIWDGTGLHGDCTIYLTCANCGAHFTRLYGLKPYAGCLPWHRLD